MVIRNRALLPHEISLLRHLSDPAVIEDVPSQWRLSYPEENAQAAIRSIIERGLVERKDNITSVTDRGIDELNAYLLSAGCDPVVKAVKEYPSIYAAMYFEKQKEATDCFHNRDYAEALSCLAVVIFLEINRLHEAPDSADAEAFDEWRVDRSELRTPFIPTDGCLIISPQTSEILFKSLEKLNWNTLQLKEICFTELQKLKKTGCPEVFYTASETIAIICDSMIEDAESLNAIYRKAWERLRNEVRALKLVTEE